MAVGDWGTLALSGGSIRGAWVEYGYAAALIDRSGSGAAPRRWMMNGNALWCLADGLPSVCFRYRVWRRYDVHHDYFDTRVYSDPSTLQLIDYGKRNRMSTVLWYVCKIDRPCRTLLAMGQV